MNRNDDSRVGGQVVRDIDVHESARRIVSKASHLLKRAGGDSLTDILSQYSGRRQCQIEEQGNKKRERRASHSGQKLYELAIVELNPKERGDMMRSTAGYPQAFIMVNQLSLPGHQYFPSIRYR